MGTGTMGRDASCSGDSSGTKRRTRGPHVLASGHVPDARECFAGRALHGVMGGFHLSGSTEAIIPDTVDALRAFDLKAIAPAHRTGWRATSAMASAFGDAVVPSAVGKTFGLQLATLARRPAPPGERDIEFGSNRTPGMTIAERAIDDMLTRFLCSKQYGCFVHRSTSERNTMPTVVAHHNVKDNAHWLASPRREELFGPLGITNIRTFVDPQNPTRVAVLMDVPDMNALAAAMKTRAATDAMAYDGVLPESLVILVEA